MRAIATLFAALVLVACAHVSTSVPPSTPPPVGSPLIGTWRLVQYETWDSTGTRQTQLGESPSGYAVFDATGHAFIQLMQLAAVSADAPATASPERALASAASFGAYFGTYVVDDARQELTITVEGSNLPTYIASKQKRPFKLLGDTLRLGVPREYQATLVRVPAR